MTMDALLEGTQEERGIIYPKQISTAPQKSIMGEYLRFRLGVPLGQMVTINDLHRYGRTDIDVSIILIFRYKICK